MEILESRPRLGEAWRISILGGQRNRIGNRPESKREQLLRVFEALCSQRRPVHQFLPYAIALPLWGY